jgi:hypothetical protein
MNAPPTESLINLKYAENIMPLWIDSAKTFAATASAALGLTVVFKDKVLGNSGRMRTSSFLLASWAFYILTIGTSIFYQWMAVHWIIALREAPDTSSRPEYYPFTWLGPHVIYGTMMICFFVGSIVLVIASAQELKRPDPPAAPSGDPSTPE